MFYATTYDTGALDATHPFAFRALNLRFLETLDRTRLSITAIPILGVAFEPDFSYLKREKYFKTNLNLVTVVSRALDCAPCALLGSSWE